jgi:hypothetical protein
MRTSGILNQRGMQRKSHPKRKKEGKTEQNQTQKKG